MSSNNAIQRLNKGKRANTKAPGNVVKGCVIHPRCPKCEKNYIGECLKGSNVCFGCKEMGHKIIKCSNVAHNGNKSVLKVK